MGTRKRDAWGRLADRGCWVRVERKVRASDAMLIGYLGSESFMVSKKCINCGCLFDRSNSPSLIAFIRALQVGSKGCFRLAIFCKGARNSSIAVFVEFVVRLSKLIISMDVLVGGLTFFALNIM